MTLATRSVNGLLVELKPDDDIGTRLNARPIPLDELNRSFITVL